VRVTEYPYRPRRHVLGLEGPEVDEYQAVQGVGLRVVVDIDPLDDDARTLVTAMGAGALHDELGTAVTDAVATVLAGQWVAVLSVKRRLG